MHACIFVYAHVITAWLYAVQHFMLSSYNLCDQDCIRLQTTMYLLVNLLAVKTFTQCSSYLVDCTSYINTIVWEKSMLKNFHRWCDTTKLNAQNILAMNKKVKVIFWVNNQK